MSTDHKMKFIVHGPFIVEKKKAGTLHNNSWVVDEDEILSFKKKHDRYNERKGCYVFATKASKGSIPIYVGLSDTNLLSEAFSSANIKKLNKYLENCTKAKILLYFVVVDKGSFKIIDECESYLIDLAKNANPKLINQRKIRKWSIEGITGSCSHGKPTNSVRQFKKCLNVM